MTRFTLWKLNQLGFSLGDIDKLKPRFGAKSNCTVVWIDLRKACAFLRKELPNESTVRRGRF